MSSETSTMPTNNVKERMQAGDVALGINVPQPVGGHRRVAKATGHDFIFIAPGIPSSTWRRSATWPDGVRHRLRACRPRAQRRRSGSTWGHRDIVAAQVRVIAAARANGKFAGCGGTRDVGRQFAAIRMGAQFVTTQTDIAFFASAAAKWVSGVRGPERRGAQAGAGRPALR